MRDMRTPVARGALTAIVAALTGLGLFAAWPAHAAGATFYVSPDGDGSSGADWAHAWLPASIPWGSVAPGDKLILDGGPRPCGGGPFTPSATTGPGIDCGMKYGAFTLGADGVTVERSADPGHDGTVVFISRATPLPYCGQSGYAATPGAATGISVGSHSGVTIDGLTRSGIVVRGFVNGLDSGSGGGSTFRDMTLFDNGSFTSHSWGYSTDGNGIVFQGANQTFDRIITDDNGQDGFHSDSGGAGWSGIKVINSAMFSLRPLPGYPFEPSNDAQSTGNPVLANGCQHADGFQAFAPPATVSGATFAHDMFGPGENQGLYPSDSGTGTLLSDVTVSDSLFLDAVAHNAISDHHTASAPTRWTLVNDTIFATQGGSELPLASSGGTGTMTGVIKQGGYLYAPTGTWSGSGNIWYLGDPLPAAANANPGFAAAPAAAHPALSALMDPAQTNLAPSAGTGAPFHTFWDVFSYMDTLNGAAPAPTPTPTATAPAVPAPGPIWGCLLPNRTLANLYTSAANFAAFLAANGGRCPSGSAVGIGLPVAVTSPLEYAARMFEPGRRRYTSPLHLARRLDPKHGASAALEHIDGALTELMDPASPDNALAISMPPQEGKSQECSRFYPGWLLDQNPSLRIAIVSYEQDMALRWGRDIKQDVALYPCKHDRRDDDGECGTDCGGLHITIRRDSSAAGRWETPAGGGVYCVGVGGPLTGRPVDVLIIDDPVKDRAAAESAKIRDTAWNWWESGYPWP